MKKTFTTAFNRTEASIRDCNVVKFEKPSKVKKSLSYAVDINSIYDKYCKTGRLPLNGQQPIYDENFVAYNDLIQAQKLVSDATLYFQGLPAKIKNYYGNSLEKFIYALNDRDEFLVNEGLLKLPVEETTAPEMPVKPVVEPDIDIQPVIPEKPVVESVNTATTD